MHPELDESVVPDRTDAELDALADNADKATNRDIPMHDAPAKSATPAAPGATGETFEIVHNGKTIKGTREQILKWAQMGYDRPQFAQKINAEKAKWEAEKAQKQQQWQVYEQVDAYAKQNKEWWDHVQKAWSTRGQPGGVPATATANAPVAQDAYNPKLQALEQKLSQFEPVVQKVSQFYQDQQQRIEDENLDREVKSIRGEHADLDWDTLDENGKSLELRILEHAQSKGIREFGIAFRDLLHKELLNKAQGQAKLAVAKGIQTRTKLGVLGETPTPSSLWNRNSQPKDIRKTSYEELEQEIREELRAGRVVK